MKKKKVKINKTKNPDQSAEIYSLISLCRTSFCSYVLQLGDNCIEIFRFGMYIVGFTVGNFALRRRCKRSFSFGEVYRRFYGRKFRFTATLTAKFPTVKPRGVSVVLRLEISFYGDSVSVAVKRNFRL